MHLIVGVRLGVLSGRGRAPDVRALQPWPRVHRVCGMADSPVPVVVEPRGYIQNRRVHLLAQYISSCSWAVLAPASENSIRIISSHHS